MTDNHYYFYLENGVQKGPATADQLARAITPRTLLWREGMEDWAAAEEIPEMRALLNRPNIVPSETTGATCPPPPSGVASATAIGAPTKPNNYLIWSILLTLLCGSVPGMVGIALGITCNQRYAEGDYRGGGAGLIHGSQLHPRERGPRCDPLGRAAADAYHLRERLALRSHRYPRKQLRRIRIQVLMLYLCPLDRLGHDSLMTLSWRRSTTI